MFGISFEHIIIVGIIFMFVGPRKLPELGNAMGKTIKNFKDSFAGIEEANFKRINSEKAPAPVTAPIMATETPVTTATTAATAPNPSINPSSNV